MATLGQTPEGLVPRSDLPTPDPLQLFVCSRQGLPAQVAGLVAEVLQPLLEVAGHGDKAALVAAS